MCPLIIEHRAAEMLNDIGWHAHLVERGRVFLDRKITGATGSTGPASVREAITLGLDVRTMVRKIKNHGYLIFRRVAASKDFLSTFAASFELLCFLTFVFAA